MMENYEEKIRELRQDLKSLGAEISNRLTCIHSNISGCSVNLRNNPTNSIKLLQHDVVSLLKEFQSHKEEEAKNKMELEAVSQLMDILTAVSAVSDCILQCELKINSEDLTDASSSIQELDEFLLHLPRPNTEIGTGKVCSILRRESALVKSRFQSKLKRLLDHCIQIEKGKIFVCKSLKGMIKGDDVLLQNPLPLGSIWGAIRAAGDCDEAVSGVLKRVWDLVLVPLWRERRAQAPTVHNTDDGACMVFEAVVRGGDALEPTGKSDNSIPSDGAGVGGSLGACRMPFPQLLEQIGSVLHFVWTEAFCAIDELSEPISRKLQSPPVSLGDTLVLTVAALVPKGEAELVTFQRQLERPCSEFETRLAAYGFGPAQAQTQAQNTSTAPTGAGAGAGAGLLGNSLSAVVANLPTHFAHARRREILSRARDLVVADYHNSMLATGDAAEDDPASAGTIGDPLAVLETSGATSTHALRFEACHVSLAACRLLRLAHEVLRQAATSSAPMANVLFHTCRDCLELFAAIVPMRFSATIGRDPRMGAVFFNDCAYIAHNCTLLTHTHRPALAKADANLEAAAGLVDFIPRFRVLGEQCLAGHVEQQRATLEELVSLINIAPAHDHDTQASSLSSSSNSSSFPAGAVDGADGGTATNDPSSGGTKGGGAGAMFGALRIAQRIGSMARRRVADLAVADPSGGPGSQGGSGTAATGAGVGGGEGAKGKGSSSSSIGAPNDEQAAEAVVRHIVWLGGEWQGKLQDTVYERLMGYLLEAVLRAAMKAVLEAECITETAGAQISRVFKTMEKSRVIFQGGSDDDDKVASVCASWRKFRALSDLINWSLSEIAEWLPRRKFSSFTGQEMSRMIRALFEDSPKRQGILNAIVEMAS